ncbi:hypothetical protein ScPMuIL_017031 [Solemya velum]
MSPGRWSRTPSPVIGGKRPRRDECSPDGNITVRIQGRPRPSFLPSSKSQIRHIYLQRTDTTQVTPTPSKGKESGLECISCIEAGKSGEILLSIDGGTWFQKKALQVIDKMKETSSSSLSTAPFLAVTGWKIFPSGPIPKAFTYGVIYEHIIATARLMSTDGGDDDEFSAAFNTSKPMSKGRQFFLSGHVNDIQDIRKNDFYFLKAKVVPSYSQTSPYNVSVTLNMTTASVVDASCDCKASAMGRCNHVAALLFALEDFTVQFGFEGLACTSDVCKWNVGRKKKKNPKPAHELRYNKKSAPDRIIEHDPRPTTSMTQDAEDDFINTFIKTLPSTREDSVFEHVLEIKYDEYEVDEADLRQRVDAAAELFREGFDSAAPAFEVDNTREQSDSPAWQEARYCRVTASNAKDVLSLLFDRSYVFPGLIITNSEPWS